MKKHLKDYFIPHEGNEYKPHSLQTAAMTGMVVLVLLSFTLANVQSLIWISSEWMVSTILPAVLVNLTNDERDDGSLLGLTRSFVLDEAAQRKAEHMAAGEYFSHYSPDGVSPWYWFNEVSYNFLHAGENLAIHFTDSDEVVDAWMQSPSHRANIMNGDFREIGIGTAAGQYEGYNTIYVVQLFGTEAALALAPDPVALVQIDTPTEEETVVNLPQIAGIEEEVQSSQSDVLPEEVPVVTDPEPTKLALSETEDVTVVSEIIPGTEPVEIAEDSIESVEITDDSVVLFSDNISTSTTGVPATIDSSAPPAGDGEVSNGFAIATQPQFVLQLLYAMIGLFVIGSLLLSILIEIRKQHPVQIAYGVAMLLLMYGLYTLHTSFSNGALIV